MTQNEITISEKYQPFLEIIQGQHKEVDTIIVTGGRYSSKSYTVNLGLTEAFIQRDWRILHTRFTNTSIKDSIKTELEDKIELLGYGDYCDIQINRVESTCGDGVISFKGIKTSSGNQTANLKSLSGFNCFVVDEAEEIPDYETFKKVYYSIRSIDKRNVSILILNPTIKTHWIFKEYFKKRGVKGGFNGINRRVLYIHTTYLDVPKDFIPENILKDYEELKKLDPETYNNVVMGGWLDKLEGQLFDRNKMTFYKSELINKDNAECVLGYVDVATGGGDYYCAVFGYLIDKTLYIDQVIYTQDDTPYTIPETVNMAKSNSCQYLWVESNNAGGIVADEVQKGLEETAVIKIHNSTNKETRIIAEKFFIYQNIQFRNDYEEGSDYDLFMQNVLSFNKDKKLNANDDAPDALSGLAKCVRKMFASLYC